MSAASSSGEHQLQTAFTSMNKHEWKMGKYWQNFGAMKWMSDDQRWTYIHIYRVILLSSNFQQRYDVLVAVVFTPVPAAVVQMPGSWIVNITIWTSETIPLWRRRAQSSIIWTDSNHCFVIPELSWGHIGATGQELFGFWFAKFLYAMYNW